MLGNEKINKVFNVVMTICGVLVSAFIIYVNVNPTPASAVNEGDTINNIQVVTITNKSRAARVDDFNNYVKERGLSAEDIISVTVDRNITTIYIKNEPVG